MKIIDSSTENDSNTVSTLKPSAVPHITTNYIPFNLIISRLIDTSYSDLVSIVETMPANKDAVRKKNIINYFIDTHEEFLKLMVLISWAKRSPEVSLTIDLFNWLVSQQSCYNNVIYSLQEIKHSLGIARLRNPDISTALQVIVKGKPRLSNFNFIPPKKLSSQTVYNTLREIDVLLSFRLTLEEELISYFKNYRIHDGRATFSVLNEFEFDVGIYDNTSSSKFFLIDFRFSFSPLIQIPIDMKMVIEQHSNTLLSQSGLNELYKFMHNFTLSHKLSLLHSQAYALSKKSWAKSLICYYFPDKRVVKINYWANLPDSRNQIVIGISKQTNQIAIKWYREGKLVKDEDLVFDNANVSAESLINKIISLHISFLISSLYKSLLKFYTFRLSSKNVKLLNKHKLFIELNPSRSIILTFDKITGKVTFQSRNPIIMHSERNVNLLSNMTLLLPESILILRLSTNQEILEARARTAGWHVYRLTPNRSDAIRKLLKTRSKFITSLSKPGWKPGWLILVVFSDDPLSWWIANVTSTEIGWSPNYVERLETSLSDPTPEYNELDDLSAYSSLWITQYEFIKSLQKNNIFYRKMHKAKNVYFVPQNLEVIFLLEMSDYIRNKSCCSALYVSLSVTQSNKICVLGKGKAHESHVLKYIEDKKQNISVDYSDNCFSLTNIVNPGEGVVTFFTKKMVEIDKIALFVTMAKSFNLKIDTICPNELKFIYNEGLKASLLFTNGKDMELKLSKDNPCLRFEPLFKYVLQVSDLGTVLTVLNATGNLIKLLVSLDSNEVFVSYRSATQFRLYYPGKGKNFKAVMALNKNQPPNSLSYLHTASDFAIEVSVKYHESKGVLFYITDRLSDVKNLKPILSYDAIATYNKHRGSIISVDNGLICYPEAIYDMILFIHGLVIKDHGVNLSNNGNSNTNINLSNNGNSNINNNLNNNNTSRITNNLNINSNSTINNNLNFNNSSNVNNNLNFNSNSNVNNNLNFNSNSNINKNLNFNNNSNINNNLDFNSNSNINNNVNINNNSNINRNSNINNLNINNSNINSSNINVGTRMLNNRFNVNFHNDTRQRI